MRTSIRELRWCGWSLISCLVLRGSCKLGLKSLNPISLKPTKHQYPGSSTPRETEVAEPSSRRKPKYEDVKQSVEHPRVRSYPFLPKFPSYWVQIQSSSTNTQRRTSHFSRIQLAGRITPADQPQVGSIIESEHRLAEPGEIFSLLG